MNPHPDDESLRDPALPPRMGKHLAALGVVGVLMVGWPLWQVMQYHGTESQGLAEVREALDPVARAVALQRSLVAHRDVADAVLRGAAGREGERLQLQAEVDGRAGALDAGLSAGRWERAAGESQALQADWTRLAARIAARSIDADGSGQGHRLLVEQTLQVIDLVADAAGASPHLAHLRLLRDAAAVPARFAQFEQAHARAAQAVHDAQQRVQRQRRSLLAGMTSLAAAALALVAGLRRRWPVAAPAPAPRPADRSAAQQLIARLRDAPPPTAAHPGAGVAAARVSPPAGSPSSAPENG